MDRLSHFISESGLAARNLADIFRGGALRLGVTGLSRAGKTVFVTALAHDLLQLGQAGLEVSRSPFPVFRVYADGRLIAARLTPQPHDAVPRFPYEENLAALLGDGGDVTTRRWPHSTRQLSELRLTLEFQRSSGWRSRSSELTIDLVDYPGEWLLDLPLLNKSFAQWSAETCAAASQLSRAPLAASWLSQLAAIDASAPFTEETARRASQAFADYLKACRDKLPASSVQPPGRFLAPGELDGSPALTFTPLTAEQAASNKPDSFAKMMERRYESYKRFVVAPFFRDHFARLERQIVLVDVLSALNAGPAALRDLENSITDVLAAFRAGRANAFAHVFRPRIDKILFAATKADLLHHSSHDRLESVLRRIAARAIARSSDLGASIDIVASSAVRATREARVREGNETLAVVMGVPESGETIDGEAFDGVREAAIFPGELPADPQVALNAAGSFDDKLRFVRFRPPICAKATAPLPHIRLDRAFQFLFGDKLT